eukprot:Rhum_TRINITY_DN10780_c0_g1::Rhum_TRINITY_DN10780_c0_g1_i1::g.40006::m.40006
MPDDQAADRDRRFRGSRGVHEEASARELRLGHLPEWRARAGRRRGCAAEVVHAHLAQQRQHRRPRRVQRAVLVRRRLEETQGVPLQEHGQRGVKGGHENLGDGVPHRRVVRRGKVVAVLPALPGGRVRRHHGEDAICLDRLREHALHRREDGVCLHAHVHGRPVAAPCNACVTPEVHHVTHDLVRPRPPRHASSRPVWVPFAPPLGAVRQAHAAARCVDFLVRETRWVHVGRNGHREALLSLKSGVVQVSEGQQRLRGSDAHFAVFQQRTFLLFRKDRLPFAPADDGRQPQSRDVPVERRPRIRVGSGQHRCPRLLRFDAGCRVVSSWSQLRFPGYHFLDKGAVSRRRWCCCGEQLRGWGRGFFGYCSRLLFLLLLLLLLLGCRRRIAW